MRRGIRQWGARGVVLCLAACPAVALAGCGSGTTTIIEKTLTEKIPKEPAPVRHTYMAGTAVGTEFEEPVEYPFAVSDLGTSDLKWADWGGQRTQATGFITQRNWSSGRPDDRAQFPVVIYVSGLERCGPRAYYTEVSFEAPKAAFDTKESYQLTTPCRDSESIQQKAFDETEEQVSELDCGGAPDLAEVQLYAHGMSCGEAALVFQRLHCLDDECKIRKSQGSLCHVSEGRSEYEAIGRCGDGEVYMEWRAFE